MNKSQKPSVAVLILNFNQWQMTRKCVQSVLKSDYDIFQVLLIDNGSYSQEDYWQLLHLQLDRCKVIQLEKNRGYVGGMNYGLELAHDRGFDLYLIMNNDAMIAPDAISKLVATSQKYDYRCIVTGKVYHYDRPNVLQFVGYEITSKKNLKIRRLVNDEEDRGQWDNEMELDMTDDIFWLLSGKIYEEVGGYSPYFWFNAEQADLALRAIEAGNKLIYTPEARIWHKGSLTIGGRGDNPTLIYYNLQASLILRYLHLNRMRFFSYYLQTLLKLLKDYFKYLVKWILNYRPNKQILYAKLKAVGYFNSWYFTRKENPGITPFDQ